MPVTSPQPVECPMDQLLRLVSGPWTSYIIWTLQHGPERFGSLKRKMPGISAKMLTERLRMLENAGIITRAVENTKPPQVHYTITERGKELNEAFESLNKVAQKWAKIDGFGKFAEVKKSTQTPKAALSTAHWL